MKAHRWLLIWVAAAALLGVGVAAQAATPAATLPATYVTATTALLRGTVDTGGQRTLWQFQYGTSKGYGSSTLSRFIPAGRGNVAISLRVFRLRQRTRYHFRLLVQTGQGISVYYPIFVNFGGDRSFVTRAGGNLGLGTPTLSLRGRYAPVSLYCAGRATCKSMLRITRPESGHPGKTLTVSKRTISLPGGQTRTFTTRLSNSTLAMLDQTGNAVGALLTLTPPSGLNKLTARVTLVRT